METGNKSDALLVYHGDDYIGFRASNQNIAQKY
jgi:hypothetical protein